MRWLALMLCCAGCTCGPGGGNDAGRSVEVVRARTLISAAGRRDVPIDLTDSDLSALIPEDGGARVIYPEVTGPGVATFTAVPEGEYLLTLGNYNLITKGPRVDLGVASLGRADVALTDGGVELVLDATGLLPWQPYSDVLQVTAENAGYVALNAQSFVGDQPDAGVTDARFPLKWWEACSTSRGRLVPRVEADAGDVVVVTQLVSAKVPDAGALELRTLKRVATLPAFTLADHASTPVSASFAPPAAQQHLSLDFRQSAFDALRAAVHPEARPLSSSVTVSALPFSTSDGFFTASPDLAVLRPQQYSADVALDFDTGNPFPTAWGRVVSVRYAAQVEFAYPDGGAGRVTSNLVAQDLLPSSAQPLVPRISPPRAVKVEGLDGHSRAEISRLPTLSWEPPAQGSPTSYGVTIYRFSRVGGGPVIAVSEQGFFETTARAVQLPFGEVNPGEEYVFGITAFEATGAQAAQAPFKSRFPYAEATALTAMMHVRP
ncbi:MAG: hypothetical protein IPJ65_27250 [Archangiaceae bacterium]|nr:hypothetical protein [Archangiaceae bacterium]